MRTLAQHPYIVAAVLTWIFNNIISVLVSSLPAPTAQSSARYVYWFKVTNTIIGNIARASSTALEKSPNWDTAVANHIAKIQQQNQQLNSTPKS